jgi:hypothetical protein
VTGWIRKKVSQNMGLRLENGHISPLKGAPFLR